MSERNYKEDLKLDQYDLIQNCLDQPELFAFWGSAWADAVDERDRQKDRLALVRSNCDIEIRETPSEFGWAKADKAPTEAFIVSAIVSHVDYIAANELMLLAQKDVNVMMIAKESFDHRRKMIEIISDLYKSGYYSGNRKLDKGYQEALPDAAAKVQTEGLAANPRLLRRKPTGEANGIVNTGS